MIVSTHIGRVGLFWYAPWRRHLDMPLRAWLFGVEHDSESWCWRVAGMQVSIRRKP